MWNSYFFEWQKKYNMRLSFKMPLIIRFDGKGVTRNKTINFMDTSKGSFSQVLEKTAQYFSERYNCYSLFGSDEISFIFLCPQIVIRDLEPDLNNYSNEVIAMFSQYFFDYFNTEYKNNKVFWHGKCFSIPEGKINSYIKYRIGIIKNVMIAHFLKHKNVGIVKTKLFNLEEQCKQFDDYEALNDIKNGILYYNGSKMAIDEYVDEKAECKYNKENTIFNNDTKIEI